MKINQILSKKEFSKEDIVNLLSTTETTEIELLKAKAYSVMKKYCGEDVHLRGLIELSNICINDCFYCGIRKSNSEIKRYILEREEIIELAEWIAKRGFGSMVLQSGERNDDNFEKFIENLVFIIKNITKSQDLPDGLGITLSLGEQNKETYQKWFNAGAHRYLLRIETTNEKLYSDRKSVV